MSCESEAPDGPGFDLLGVYYEETGQSAEAFRRLFPFCCRWLKWFKSFNFTLFTQESFHYVDDVLPFHQSLLSLVCNIQRLSPHSKMSLSVPFPSSFLSPLPPSDILLTHNCGSPPPIAGNNPLLRPHRHTFPQCFPTMHLSSKTFPYTFGLLIVPLLLHPSNVPFLSLILPCHFIGQFTFTLCSFQTIQMSLLFSSPFSWDPSGWNIGENFPEFIWCKMMITILYLTLRRVLK